MARNLPLSYIVDSDFIEADGTIVEDKGYTVYQHPVMKYFEKRVYNDGTVKYRDNHRIQTIAENTPFFGESFEYLDEGVTISLGETFGDSNLHIQRFDQSVMMETPWKVEVCLTKTVNFEHVGCPLAEVSYGIREENEEKVCYVYSMMKPKDKSESSDREKLFRKRLNRELYKLNDGVLEQENEEYLFFGKVTLDKYGSRTMLSPKFELAGEKQRLRPIYKATSSMPSIFLSAAKS